MPAMLLKFGSLTKPTSSKNWQSQLLTRLLPPCLRIIGRGWSGLLAKKQTETLRLVSLRTCWFVSARPVWRLPQTSYVVRRHTRRSALNGATVGYSSKTAKAREEPPSEYKEREGTGLGNGRGARAFRSFEAADATCDMMNLGDGLWVAHARRHRR